MSSSSLLTSGGPHHNLTSSNAAHSSSSSDSGHLNLGSVASSNYTAGATAGPPPPPPVFFPSASTSAGAMGASTTGSGGGRGLLNRIQGVFADSFTSSSSHVAASLPKAHIDRKLVEKVYKFILKTMRLCQQPRVNLKNSPPYILDILSDMCKYLKDIMRVYEDKLDDLNEVDYFLIFMTTLIEKCKHTIKLFKEGKDNMYDEESLYRHKLTKFSLVFSHLLKDLQAMFPNYTYSTCFTVTKQDAASWWKSNFEQRTIVPWRHFRKALFQSCGVEDPNQVPALQSTIDLTCNDHVSIFEFDVFVRLFQPWNNILETWKALAVVHPGYMAFMTYDEVKAVLSNYISSPGPGSYVFRLSCTKLGQWAIGYVTQDKQILQTIIQNKSLAQALLDGEREGFYKYPNGKVKQLPDLYSLVHNLPQVHIKVTQEQYQIYCEMGSTFQVCKICAENDKNIRLEPCRHLLCRLCLTNWQASGEGHSCPFCRCEIKGTEEIVVDAFPSPSPYAATTSPSLVPPPRPPRLAGAASPAVSPSNHRRRVPPAPVVYTSPLLEPEVTAVRPRPPVNTDPASLNYATLEFTDSDTDLEDLPPAPPPPPNLAAVQSDDSGGGDSALEYNVRALVQDDGITDRVARRLLAITQNNLQMSREILLYFVAKPGL